MTDSRIQLVQTSAGAPEAYDAVDENGRVVGLLHLRRGYFSVTVGTDTEVYGKDIGGDYSVFDADERQRYLDTAVRKIREHLDGRTPEDTAQDIAEALEQAAIADWDDGEPHYAKVIEIYVSQIAPIVTRILKGEKQ